MPVINNNKLGIDLPVWEQLRDAQGGNSSALSTSCTALNPVMHINFGRYIYYLNAAASFWRYDTWTDTYVQLSSPPITPATFSTMRFGMSVGVEGNIISASANTAYIPANFGKTFRGYDISIIGGTGIGQRRTIVDVSDAVIEDVAVATATSNGLGTINLTDTSKNWPINRWVGYQARVVQGSGVGQMRRIIYNTPTILGFADSTIHPYEVFCNSATFSPAINSAAGAQTVVNIEASNVTVDFPWSVIPDSSSRYKVEGGSILLISSAGATPFYTFQQYDILTDIWYIRSAITNNIAAVGTDATLERTGDQATVWDRGKATINGTTNTLTDSSKGWSINQWVTSSANVTSSYYVRIFSGTGEGQQAKILSNTATTLTFESMSVAPTTSSQYFIDGFDAGKATSGSVISITDSTKNWSINRWKNYAVRIVSGSGVGQIIPILSNTTSSLTLYRSSSVTLDSSSVYNITADPDKLYLNLGANAGVALLNLSDDLITFSRNEDSGLANNAAVRLAGIGSGRPQGIASVSNSGTTATITTTNVHTFRVGQTVVVRGANDAFFNGTFTISAIPATNQLQYVMTGTPSVTTLAGSQTTTQLFDSTKNWAINQWAGYTVYMTTSTMTAASGLVSGQNVRIASNSSSSLTFIAPATAPTTGLTRYMITKTDAIGNMFSGFPSGSVPTTTTIQDINVNFSGSASIAGNLLTVTTASLGYIGIGSLITGSGIVSSSVITSFGPNTFGGAGTYTISPSQSVALTNVTSLGWMVNYYAGRRVKILSGTGQSQESTISSNTANTLTFATVTTAPGLLSSSYCILQQPIRGTGIESEWVHGSTDPNLQGRRLYVPRGGGVNNFDYIDIPTDKVEAVITSPQGETLTTGTMYAYDGADRIYFTKDVTMRFYYLDTNTGQIHGAGFAPFGTSTAIIGNRMEVFTTPDGVKYLWLVKHTLPSVMRSMLYY